MSVPILFSDEQKQYLQGFMAGATQRGLTTTTSDHVVHTDEPTGDRVYGTPVVDLCKEERIKHEHHGLDTWDRIVACAEANTFPVGGDAFRFKYHGLFHLAPAQDAYMLRMRIPGGLLSESQLTGLAALVDDFADARADITTRANLQARNISAANGPKILVGLAALGLTSQGSGADNIRNITASPTCGIDPHEVYDVRPLARGLHHYILNHRFMYDLPRKFNVAFDNGGDVSVVADTNDIGFYAVRVPTGTHVPAGVYFRVQLGGISGHQQLASDTGLLLRPEDCVKAAIAMIQVFIENGDRTNRKKARLKYLLDSWGVSRYLEEVEVRMGTPFVRLPLEDCEPRRDVTPHGWLGVHPQRQAGLNYLGVCIPVGRLTSQQMRGLAAIARDYGSRELRLTVWQNLIIPGVPDARVADARLALRELGLETDPGHILGGLVACTGNAGCKFAAANTKAHAVRIGDYLHERLSLPAPINIHLTGCSHSCAQHYCGDIGLQAVAVQRDGESVEGYNLVVGGGVDNQRGIARQIAKGLAHDDIEATLERLLRYWMAHRTEAESFVDFCRRHDTETLSQALEAHV